MAGVRCLPAQHPGVIGVQKAEDDRVWRRKTEIRTRRRRIQPLRLGRFGLCAAPALTGFGHHCIHVDEVLESRTHAVSDGGAQHPGIGVNSEHHIGQLFGLHQLANVLNMCFERDARRQQMRPFAQAGERDGMHALAMLLQRMADATPAPCAVPRTMNQYKVRHQITCLIFKSATCSEV